MKRALASGRRKTARGDLGLFQVYTGCGKGKTTAALGLALRAIGQGFRVIIVQFLKGKMDYGEHKAARWLASRRSGLGGRLRIVRTGLGCLIGPRRLTAREFARHRMAASDGLRFAARVLRGGKFDIVVLDEICCALKLGLLDLDEVLGLVDNRPPGVELVFTGRYAPRELIARADLVTEMKEIKHPYKKGIKARRGVEF